MIDKFQAWHPIKNVPPNLYIYEMEDTSAGLMIILEEFTRGGEKPFVKMYFPNYYGYINSLEGDLLKTLKKHPEIMTKHSLFISKRVPFHSFFISGSPSFVEPSLQKFDTFQKVLHFLITTQHDIFEIVAPESPLVSWIPLGTPFHSYLSKKHDPL